MSQWKWVVDKSFYWSSHAVSPELEAALVFDLTSRTEGDPPFFQVTEIPEIFLDMPGMILKDRRYQKISVDGLSIEIPSQDVEDFLMEARLTEVDKFVDGREYYKVLGYLRCLVLTPEQRRIFISELERVLPQARIEAEQDNAEFNRRIEAVNNTVKGLGIEVIFSPRPTGNGPVLDPSKAN